MLPCEVINLNKMFGKHVGVSDVSLTLKPGEVMGFIGPNGAGKSTTIKALLGLIKPTQGDVALFGENAAKDNENVRKEVGYSPSEPSFFGELTVKDNIKFLCEIKQVSTDKAFKLATRLELNLTKKAKTLSFGNKKKLAIVLATLSSPQLLVLDEPTLGLDPLIKQEFFKIIEEEKKRGATILISSHMLTDVQRLCDRVAIIKNGKIIAVEQMEQLKLKRLKIVTFETRYSVPNITLSGVSNLKQEGQYTKFNYNGNIKKLLSYIESLDVENVDITDADLENIFLHFYE